MLSGMSSTGVIFDLDGTLVNTLDDIADAMNAVLAENGLPPHPVDAYRTFIGNGMRNLVRSALPERFRGAGELDRIFALMIERYGANLLVKTAPYPGVRELLGELRKRSVPCAVHSNKPHDQAVRVVAALFPDEGFFEVRGQEDGVPRKPDPEVALRIARFLQLDPREMIYLGDSDVDMKTALAAGMRPIGAAWGFRGAGELLASGAEVVIERPGDLLELLNRKGRPERG